MSIAAGAYGISFGAIALAGGFDVAQTMALSLLMFTGGSQLGPVGVVAGGGAPMAGAATAVLLGLRNALDGLRRTELLALRGGRRFASAQLIIDESTTMSIGRGSPRAARLGFYTTGLGVFVLWNLGTLIGVVGAAWLADPRARGLDGAAPAASLPLLAPRLRGREAWAIALVAALVAVLTVPFVPIGFPVLIAAGVGIAAGFLPGRPGPQPTGVAEIVAEIEPAPEDRR